MRAWTAVRVVEIAVAVSALAGCGRSSIDPYDGETIVDPSGSPIVTTTSVPATAGGCQRDRECPDGQVCAAGECVDPTHCEANIDCAPNEVCADGRCRCVSGCITCASTPECPSGRTCQNGICVGSDGACTQDDQCRPAQECLDGACIPVVPCDINLDCEPGLICVAGFCDGGVECRGHADCPVEHVCRNGGCQLLGG